ncbi:peptidoglycan-binding domain-containing protein [Streptomyces ziwulingensis]|uniref:peptidoglycan-binding domain-containing protein n=1 Tax=Streptomyces ziwulingensis TaxID=1045501 RepID=UPI0031E731B8
MTAPSATDLSLFEGAAGLAQGRGAGQYPADGEPARRPGRSRSVLVSAAGAAVLVLGVAGFAGGLFSYESPSRDSAAQEVRAGVPAPSTGTASAAAATGAASAPASPSPSEPSGSASASGSASPSASPSASSASPSAPGADPTLSATSTTSGTPATAPEEDGPDEEDDDWDGDGDGDGVEGSVLRRGDRGPEVTELQRRLGQLHLYLGDDDGDFDSRVEDAVRTFQWARGIRDEELGTYGLRTREQLERETREP